MLVCFFPDLYGQTADKIILQTNKTSYVPGDSILFTVIIPQIKEDISVEKKLKFEVLNQEDSVLTYKYFNITNGISKGTLILPILKYFKERSVCAPHYLSAGTLILPKLSDSILDAISVLSYITNDNF